MSYWFSGVSSGLRVVYLNVVCTFSGYYLIVMGGVLFWFLSYRFPYLFSSFIFMAFLWVALMSCFFSLFLCRANGGVSAFISGFVPVGTPLGICPLVSLAETISYIIRPLVLMLRPFINISLGCVGSGVLGGFALNSGWLLLILCIVFLYELFVALVHWFIVTSILSFSVDH
uniref:ATP synthase F0 subunit 6 n=1 Tax=Khawia sinensis TaxID=125900 RepID=A0A1W5IXY2_9CEST|nr:ATP synthase F0 subunit 6 [Khawia sinensis]ALK26532.1 ATP synthase F0 subunit 6 [Khawia sinensis]